MIRLLWTALIIFLGLSVVQVPVVAGEYSFTRIADDSGGFAPFTAAPVPSIAPDGTVAFIATHDAGGITSVNTGNGGTTTELVRTSFLGFSTITGPTSQDNGGAVYFLGQEFISPLAIYKATTSGESVLYGGAGLSQHTVPRVNDSGVAAFRAAETLVIGDLTIVFGSIYKGDGGTLTLVATEGISGTTSLEPRPAIDANGVVAYLTDDGSGEMEVLRNTDIASTPTLIAGTTGDISEIIGIPDLEESGTVIFTAQLTDGRTAIRSGDGGSLATRVATGPHFSDLSDPAISAPDAIAFWGELADGSGEGVFTGRDPVNQSVISTGDFLDGSTVVTVAFDPVGMNNTGQIAFRALLADGRTGIYRADPGGGAPRELRIGAAVSALQSASLIPPAFHFEKGLFRSFFGKVPAATGLPAVQAETFVENYRDLFDWAGPLQILEPVRVEDLGNGDLVRMRQTYKGLPIFGAELNVAIEPDGTQGPRITAVVGGILPELPNLKVIPAFPPGPCIDAARAALGDSSAEVVGKTELVIFDGRLMGNGPAGVTPGTHLAYRIHLAGLPGMVGFLVDANTAQVVLSYGLEPDSHPLIYHLLIEESYGLTMKDTGCFVPGAAYPDLYDEDGTLPAGAGDQDALALWQFAAGTWDFYLDTFGRCSHNGVCSRIDIHARGASGARYSSACDEFEFGAGWPSRDVMTHEFTHGVIQHTSDLIYMHESGALNESYADTMGWIEDAGDDLLGEDRVNGSGAIRSMSDPADPDYGQPDTYSGYTNQGEGEDNDFGGVHFNSGITNKAHWLMAQGGDHNGIPLQGFPPIQGIGRNKLGELIYYAMRIQHPFATMSMAAETTRARAAYLMATGAFTFQDWCDVRNALAAVELGQPDSDCDGVADQSDDSDGDSIPDALDNCPADLNYSQSDCDGNGTGDACEPDTDSDGIVNGCDNCLSTKNPSQIDTNGDGEGDACDNDWDGDTITNSVDNCPWDANVLQEDTDGEGTGDACDVDLDDDGWFTFTDNCPFTANPGQEDADGDGKGDVCDGCPTTNDPASGYTSGLQIPGQPDVDPQPIEPDSDGDGTPDACDPFAFDLASLLVDSDLFNPSFAVVPIGGSSTLTLSIPADTVLNIPIDICDPDTPSTLTNAGRFELVISGLNSTIEGALVDAARTRRIILSDDIGGERGLWVWPDCGRKWYLQLYSDSFSGSDTFDLASTYLAQTATGNPWTQLPGLGVPPPPLPDQDSDGLIDDIDTCPNMYDPTNADLDGDAQGDVCDNDDDGDGLLDVNETNTGIFVSPNDTGTDPLKADTDGDGYGDGLEVSYGTDPVNNASFPVPDGDLAPFGSPDGNINAGDLVVAVRIALGLLTPGALELAHGDMNRDGVINSADIMLITQALF